MSFKILEKNGVDNENIDGAAFNNFSAGGRDGIVAGVLSECSLSLSGNVIGIAPGELILHGFRVKITETETFSNSSVPVSAEKYQIIAQIVVSDNNDVVFSFLIRSPATLIQENIFDNNRGTYQIEIGTYMHNPDGSISELTRTVQVFYADIHKSAEEAKAASKEAAASAAAAQNAAKDAAQAASTAIADYITHTKNGAAVGEVDTLAGAKAEVSVESKNLFDLKLIDVTSNGITYTQNSDGSITVNGTATGKSYAYIINYNTPIKPGIYTLSGCPSGGSTSTYRINLGLNSNGVWKRNVYDVGDSVTFEVALPINQISGYIEIMSGTTVENLTFYPQLEYGETATPYTPYLSEGTEVEVLACGKNIFNPQKIAGRVNCTSDETGYGFTRTNKGKPTDDGGIIWYKSAEPLRFLRGQTITLSANVDIDGPYIGFQFAGSSFGQNNFATSVNGKVTVTAQVPEQTDYIQIIIAGGNTVTNKLSNIRVNIGDKALGFEEYQGQDYSSQVGQTIKVEQYDRITNIFTNTAGASLAVQFKISTQLYLDRFGLIEEGLFANRPTDISEQSRVYIATDRFDNSRYTYLKGGVDGSVTENWTEIVNYGQDNLQTKVKELVPAINEVNAAAGIALLNIPKSAKETGAFISGDNTLAGAKAEVEVESKNLIPYPYVHGGETSHGVTITIQPNGLINVNGAITEEGFTWWFLLANDYLLPAGTYTLTGCPSTNPDRRFKLDLEYDNGVQKEDYGQGITFTLSSEKVVKIYMVLYEGYTGNYTFYPQLEHGETATPYTPYLPAGTEVEVLASNSNLISADIANTVFDGVTCTFDKATQIFTLNGTKGTATGSWTTGYTNELPVTKGETYIIQSEILGGTYPADVNTGFYYYVAGHSADPDWQIVCNVIKSPTNVVTIKNDGVFDRFYIYISSGTYENFQFRIWLARGSEPTAYIPHEDNAYPATVGQTIEVEQYDRITNIFTNTAGASLAVQFKISTQLYLDRFGLIEEGLFANRPTDISEQSRVYIATDRFDNSRYTYLKGGVDGSVTENWTEIVNYGQDNLQTKVKELVPAINEVNAAAGIALLNIPKSAKETGAFISGDNTLAGAKAEVEVESENLIPFPYARSGGTQDGVTWTVADDGTITATGTATGSSGLVIFLASETAPIPVNGQYTLSLNKQGEGANAVFAELEKDGAYQGGYYNDTTFSYQNSNITVIRILASAGYTYNCTIKPKFQVGAVATAYTPYLSEGTAVEVQACGKNLFDITTLKPPTTIDSLGGLSDIIQVTNGEMINPRPLYSNSAYINIPVNLIKGTYTISGECWIDLNDPQGYLVYIGMWAGKKAGGSINTTITPGQWTKVQYTYIVEDLHAFTLQFQQGGNTASDTCTLKVRNIQLEYGDKATFYASYEGLTYPATVGQTIEVEQYDRVTNIFSNTTGAAASTQFLQSTRYELDTKPVSLAGTYAERPTGTYPYIVLYTATDRSGETYRLEANADGSVSANWVKINGMFQHNIVISPDGLTYFSVTLFSVEDYKYSLNDLVKWLDQKGFNANGKDYTNVSGIIKPESEVLIVSHIKVLDGNLTVAASSAVTGNISENTISNVVALNDTVI